MVCFHFRFTDDASYSPDSLCPTGVGKKSWRTVLLIIMGLFQTHSCYKACILETEFSQCCKQEMQSALQLFLCRSPIKMSLYCKCSFVRSRDVSNFTIISTISNLLLYMIEAESLLTKFYDFVVLMLVSALYIQVARRITSNRKMHSFITKKQTPYINNVCKILT